MLSSPWHNQPPADKANLLPPEATVAYTVPYSWGSLQMTESAKQAYQMVPLVPEVLPGAHKTSVDKANPFRTDIVIVGPDELKSADYGSATDVGLRLVSHRDGLKIGVGMARDFAGQREQLVSILRQHFGSLEHLFVSDHIPLDEAVEQQITPMLAHAFSGIVGDTVNGMSVDYLRAYAARNLYTRIRQISAFSIGFCAVVDIPPLVEQHAVDPVSCSVPAPATRRPLLPAPGPRSSSPHTITCVACTGCRGA